MKTHKLEVTTEELELIYTALSMHLESIIAFTVDLNRTRTAGFNERLDVLKALVTTVETMPL